MYNIRNVIYYNSGSKAVLAGLFSPINYQVWNKDFLWQPIPVHTVELERESLMYGQGSCPKYLKLLDQVVNGSEFKNVQSDNKDVFEVLNKGLGFDNITLYSLEFISDYLFIVVSNLFNFCLSTLKVFEILGKLNWLKIVCFFIFSQKENHLELPSWLNESVYSRIRSLGRNLYQFWFYSVEMARLLTGPLLNKILNNMLGHSLSSTNQLFLFSGHDNNLAGLLKLLNIRSMNLTQPNYASCLVFELHKSTISSQRYVHVKWKDNMSDQQIEFEQVEVVGCGSTFCPIEKFVKLSKALVVEDYLKECKLEPVKGSMIVFYGLVSSGAVILGLVGICGIYQFRINKRKFKKLKSMTNESIQLIISDDEIQIETDEVFNRIGLRS